MMAKVKAKAAESVKVTLIKSVIGRIASHRACVAGLGLRRLNQTVEVLDTPANRGMINKVSYLLKVNA
jgi:large subunit ribosomal protein L30